MPEPIRKYKLGLPGNTLKVIAAMRPLMDRPTDTYTYSIQREEKPIGAASLHCEQANGSIDGK